MTALPLFLPLPAAPSTATGRVPSPLRAWVHEEFATLLDTVGGRVALFDARGRLLHATAAWVGGLPVRDRQMVEGAVRQMLHKSIGVTRMTVTVGTYAVQLTLVQLHGADRPCAVATLIGAPPVAMRPDWQALAASHGLPARMAEVAGLIAEGLTNDEIALRLRVSPSTVRRHTERILHRLGVERRSGVAGRLTAPAPHSAS